MSKQGLFDMIGLDVGFFVIGIMVVMIVLLVLVIVLFNKNSKITKKYNAFMQGSNGETLERAFQMKFSQVDGLIKKTQEIDGRLQLIDETLLGTYQKMGLVKYDAFDMGGKLSFALALLNDKNDGFIINSMHSTREGCYTYAKEVIKGESFVILATEEKQALEMAMGLEYKK